MNSGMTFGQLKQAETIPPGSILPMGMGDGTGTKKVTKETLVKEICTDLNIGDITRLQTENKENLVEAINELAQSGGGGATVDILDTKEEIEANTETGKAAGAQAVKEMFGALNDNLGGFTPVIDENTGKMTGYKTAVGGADTVFPFTNGREVIVKNNLEFTKSKVYDLGIEPLFILFGINFKASYCWGGSCAFFRPNIEEELTLFSEQKSSGKSVKIILDGTKLTINNPIGDDTYGDYTFTVNKLIYM